MFGVGKCARWLQFLLLVNTKDAQWHELKRMAEEAQPNKVLWAAYNENQSIIKCKNGDLYAMLPYWCDDSKAPALI